jgi:acyl-CoA thioesterase
VIGESRTTPATLGFLADMVPIAVCRAAGVEGAGTSLDNSLRVGRLVDTEWVLVELEAHAAADGYGYGVSHLWAPDGTLLATGSQTAKLFSFASFLRRLEGDDRPS